MNFRTPVRESLRWLVTACAVVLPPVAPSLAPLTAAVLGARLAYDGPRSRGIVPVALLLLGMEVMTGTDIGIVTLPYLAAALLAAAAVRVVSFPALAAADGWDFRAGTRSLLAACMLAATITAGAVLVGGLYGYGAVGARLEVVFAPEAVQGMVGACAALLLTLRRIDIPFRRPLTFPTR